MATITTGRPGVFVSESLIPLNNPNANSGLAVAAFVGAHNVGPVGPTLVTSWSQWNTLFGGFGNGANYLPFAIYEFFANGGSQCWAVRAVASDAINANISLMDIETPTPTAVLKLTAIAPGVCGNSLFVDIVAEGTNSGRFNMFIHNGSASSTPVESYVDVTLNPNDSRNLVALVNATVGGSQYVTASYLGPASWGVSNTPAAQTGTPLTAGSDGVAALNLVNSAQLLESVPGILNINLPGISDPTVINPLISWAAGDGNKFMVVDGPTSGATYAATVSAYEGLSPLNSTAVTPFTSSSYVAVYGPWLNFQDPSSGAANVTRALPPGGAMLGLYEQADSTAGTQQSAAGASYPIANAVSAQTTFQPTDLDSLNQYGINILRPIAGAQGVIPMGARTLMSGMPSRYISIRRTLMYLRQLVIQSTNFAVFRPNNADLWTQITSILTNQLSILQQSGVLQGATAAEAFYVVCDGTNNSANSIANGIVNITVGVALNTPAEFIVIQIGQIASGASATDSLSH